MVKLQLFKLPLCWYPELPKEPLGSCLGTLYDFTKHVLRHTYWSCSLWASCFSRERSSYQCSIERKLWRLRRKNQWNGNCNFSISCTAAEETKAEIWKRSILVLNSAALCLREDTCFGQSYIWDQFLCCFFHRAFIPWWLALSNPKLSIDTVSAFLGWNPGLCLAKNHVISKSGRFCILNNLIPWYSKFAFLLAVQPALPH